MEIGFVHFDNEALRKAKEVLSSLEDAEAVDELGLGRIRNAFSDELFPGISTQQKHAKYFLLLPALYAYLERNVPMRSVNEAREKVEDYEIIFTKRLMDGSQKGTTGIIGSDSIKKRNEYVKYDPAYIYQTGLEKFGFVKKRGNIYRLLSDRSDVYIRKEDIGEQVFVPCPNSEYYFDRVRGDYPLQVELCKEEAEFLKSQITRNTQGTLLCHILEKDLDIKKETKFEHLEDILKNAPSNLYHTYILANRFSRFASLLRRRYAMLLEGTLEDEKWSSYLAKHRDEFTTKKIEEVLESDCISNRVKENTCKYFCREAVKRVEREDIKKGLDKLIREREIAIKGGRSKFNKPENGGANAYLFTYRWENARTIITEIKKGLEDE